MTTNDIDTPGPAEEPSKQPSTNHPANTDDKLLVLAVGLREGKIVITPIDLEFETDDQTPLSKAEQTLFKRSEAKFEQHRNGCEQALQALHTMFAGRLHREKFASFDKFCFALLGMSLPEDKMAKLKAKVKTVASTLAHK